MAPTIDMAVESWLHGLSFDITGAQIDYSNATMTIHCCGALQTSSTHVYQTQMHHIWRIWGNYGGIIHGMFIESWRLGPPQSSTGHLVECCISPMTTISCRAPQISSSHIYQTQLHHIWRIGAIHTRYVQRELTSSPAIAHHQDISSSVASTP